MMQCSMFVINLSAGPGVSGPLTGNQLREIRRGWFAPPDPSTSTNHNIAYDIQDGGNSTVVLSKQYIDYVRRMGVRWLSLVGLRKMYIIPILPRMVLITFGSLPHSILTTLNSCYLYGASYSPCNKKYQ